MRAAKVILLIWALLELGLWIRHGESFCIVDALPFMQRPESFSRDYDWLALAALLIGLWGYLMLPQPPLPPTPKGKRFRAGIILVPLTIIGLALLSQRLRSTLSFSGLVNDPGRILEHRHLALLGLAVFAVVLALKALRNR